MPNLDIEDVRGLTEPMAQYLWEISILNPPGGGDGEALKFRAKTTSIPDMVTETTTINWKAHQVKHQGRDASAHTIELTLWDSVNLPVYRTLYTWQQIVLGRKTGLSTDKSLYSCDIVLELLTRESGGVLGIWTLKGAQLENVAAIPLSYESSEPIEISATFQYDYFLFQKK